MVSYHIPCAKTLIFFIYIREQVTISSETALPEEKLLGGFHSRVHCLNLHLKFNLRRKLLWLVNMYAMNVFMDNTV